MSKKITGMLVGVAGRKRHGKDTVADLLCTKYAFVKIGFADPLKQIIGRQLLYLTEEQMEDGPQKELVDPRWGKSPRKLLQLIGTDMFRKVLDEEFWVRRCMYRVAEIWSKDPGARIVINDVRFPNELHAVKKVGSMIRVRRTDMPLDDTHESEMALDRVEDNEFDKVIEAKSGEIDVIRYETDLLIEELLYQQERQKNAV